jgi:hypothetical protein
VKTPRQVFDFVATARQWSSGSLRVQAARDYAAGVEWDEPDELATLAQFVERIPGAGSDKLAYLFRQASANAADGDPDSTAGLIAGFAGGVVDTVASGADTLRKGAKTAGRAYVSGLKATPLLWAGALLAGAWFISRD